MATEFAKVKCECPNCGHRYDGVLAYQEYIGKVAGTVVEIPAEEDLTDEKR